MLPAPLAITDYQSYMEGTDRFDQMQENYPIGFRSIKSWRRIAYWLINAAMINAKVIYDLLHPGAAIYKDPRAFRRSVADGLIGAATFRAHDVRRADDKCCRPCVKKVIGRGAQDKDLRKPCVLCHAKTPFYCSSCSAFACVGTNADCFNAVHNMKA
jgi:hypothetical protein